MSGVFIDVVRGFLERGYVVEDVVTTSRDVDCRLEEFMAEGELERMLEYIAGNRDVFRAVEEIIMRRPGTHEYVVIHRDGSVEKPVSPGVWRSEAFRA